MSDSTIGATVTGSTGNAIQDGTVRGALIALVNIAIGLVVLNVSLSDEEIALIYAAVNPAFLVLFGVFDSVRSSDA